MFQLHYVRVRDATGLALLPPRCLMEGKTQCKKRSEATPQQPGPEVQRDFNPYRIIKDLWETSLFRQAQEERTY